MKKRLLFITHHKLDENNGGCNAAKGFLHCFSQLFDDCSVICHKIDHTSPYIPSGVEYYPMQDNRSKPRKLIDMYRGAISGHYYFVREHLRSHHYDIVVIDHTFTGAGLSKYIKQTGARLITIHHNVERDYLRDNGKEKPLPYRLPFLYYCRKSERDCLQYSDVNLTVTERDAETFRSWYPGIHVYKWGIFEYRDIPQKAFPQRTKEHTFVITGSLYFEQSLRPILSFIIHYWPLVLKEIPKARLIIAGRNPSTQLQKACLSDDSITLIANPDDMGAVVSTANYYICPISAGSGLKLRILDGLRQGLPVICHEIAAAGYESLAAGGCLFSYSDEGSFIEALHSMTASCSSPQQVYQLYNDSFSLESGVARLTNILQQENIL